MPGRSNFLVMFALFVACVVLTAPGAQARQVEIHPRVGNELDDEERRYFNLFRQWPAGSVTARPTVLGGIRFAHSDSINYSLIRSDSVLVSLGTYLDRFEHLDGFIYSLDWTSLNGIARYSKRYFPRRPYTFVSLSGEERKAMIVHADDDGMWISTEKAFEWSTVDQSVLRVDGTRIARITRRRHWLAIMYRSALAMAVTVVPWRQPIQNAEKLDIGRYVGAAGTAYAAASWALTPRRHEIAGRPWRYALARHRIGRKEAFPSDFLAPELRVQVGRPGPELFEDDHAPPVVWRPGWYVAFSNARLSFPDDRSGYYATGFGLPKFEYASTDWTHVEIGLDYDERFSFGLETRFAFDPETGEPVMDYSGLLITALAEWHPWRPELHSYTRRFWVSVGAGPTLARLVSGTVIEWTPQITSLEPRLDGRDDFAQKATLAAMQLRGRVSFAVNNRLSITARASAWLPPFQLDGKEPFRVGRVTYYELDGFSLKYGVSFGVVHRFGRR